MSIPSDPRSTDPVVSPSGADDRAAAVLAVPGVTGLFAPRAGLAALPRRIAADISAGLAADGEAPPIPVQDRTADVGVDRDDEGTTVTARIATSAQVSTTDAARNVADVLLERALLEEAPEREVTITVQVARIR